MRSAPVCVILCLACVLGAPVTAVEEALGAAAAAVAEGRLDDALSELRRSFEAGYPTPGDVYADPRFAALREAAGTRGAWRELMGDFVRESELTMVPAAEPGARMVIRGRVLSSPDGAPVVGAVVHLYHTDDTGNYEPGRPAGDGSNPRLFSWVLTDERGRFVVHTIKPGHYPGSSPGGAHVHYRVRADGLGSVADEFRPYTWPRDEGERRSALRRARPTSQVFEESTGLTCDVVIPLQPR